MSLAGLMYDAERLEASGSWSSIDVVPSQPPQHEGFCHSSGYHRHTICDGYIPRRSAYEAMWLWYKRSDSMKVV